MKTRILILLMLVAVCYAGINRGPILSSERPFLQMIVNFRTENSCVAEIYYRKLPSGSWEVAADPVATNSHHISMDTDSYSQYEYFVIADGDSVGTFSYWTAPLPGEYLDFNFCAYGDTRTSHIPHSLIINHIEACNPMFQIHTGDIVEDGEDTGDWDTYFTIVSEWYTIAQSVPFFYAMGNHDDESPYFYDAVQLPSNNPEHTEAYSSFDWGRIHFFSMNSEIDYSSTSPQYAFLESDLATASVSPAYDFIIGIVHRPFYSSGYHGREEAMAASLEPLLINYSVDLVLQGHDHLYERTYPQYGVYYIVTGGGGAPPSPVFFWQDYSAFGYNLYHHLELLYDASEPRLSIYMHNYADDIVDSLILYSTPLGVTEHPLPRKSSIEIYPNPFNESCRIIVQNPADNDVVIYDLSGRLINRIPSGGSVTEDCGNYGSLAVTWDGTDSDNTPVPSGIYLIGLYGTGYAKRAVLLK